MTPRTRLSAEERHRSILTAAIPLFAAKGFKGTTTKMIAKAACVSEALLYRHFPSKESIYLELRDYICTHKDEVLGYMSTLPTGTEPLVLFVHFLVHHIFLGDDEGHPPGLTQEHMNRLMANSYLEDGEFARLFLEHTLKCWKPFLLKCMDSAMASGDMVVDEIPQIQKLWFGHHIAVALSLFDLPEKMVVEYGQNKTRVARHAVHFVLRGMGLKEEAILKYYNPDVFPDLHGMLQAGKHSE